jgi:hypothetical protein
VRGELLANLERMTLEDVRAAWWARDPPGTQFEPVASKR